MASRRSSVLEDIIAIASKLPWWVGVGLALVCYLVFHNLASRPAVTLTSPGQLERLAAGGIWSGIATVVQYILPFALLCGALISGINSIRSKKVYNNVSSRPDDMDVLKRISWQDFERLIGEYYRRQGFRVTREGGNGADGGVDLVLQKGSETYLVQCKQ